MFSAPLARSASHVRSASHMRSASHVLMVSLVVMLLAVFCAPASASVTFERTPHEDEKGVLEPAPITPERSEQKAWRLKAARRGVYAAIDSAVRWRAAPIDACMRAAGAASGAVAKVDLSLLVDGTPSFKAAPGADPTLVSCITTAIGRQQLPVALHRGVRLSYTATWDASVPAAATPAAKAPAEIPTAPAAAPAAEPATAPAAEPAAAPPVATETPAVDPERDAFSPLVDLELGFGPVLWGGRVDDHEGFTSTSRERTTTLYVRQSDRGTRWLGAPVGIVSYAFGEEGFYCVTLAALGSTTAWKLRQVLAERYGPSRWDTRFGAYYWRGESVVVQLRPVLDTVAVTILDIARARASGLADRLPGDRDDPTEAGKNDRRMPKIFRE